MALWARECVVRRRDPDLSAPAPPAELLLFDADQWPGRDAGQRFDAFCEARRAHLDVHGWPGGADAEIASLPDEPWWEGII